MVTLSVQQSKRQVDFIWACILLLSFSIHWPDYGLVPISFLVGVVRFPRAYRALRTGRSLRPLLFMTALALAVGAFLRFTISDDVGTSPDLISAIEVGIWILSMLVLSVTGAYALGILGMRKGLTLFATSSLVGNWLYYGLYIPHDPETVWKYVVGYSISLIVILMAVRGRTQHVLGIISVATVLVVVSMSLGARSQALIIGIAALLALPRPGTGVSSKRGGVARHALMSLMAVSTAAWFLTTAMQQDWFGDHLRQVYERQTAHGNSLLLGGRTESAATFQLMQMHVVGFGLGTRPSDGFLRQVVGAVARAGGAYMGPYYPTVVFGQRVDLHSMAADLWFHAGFGGLALVACIGIILVSGSLCASRNPSSIGFACQLLIWQAIWDLGFSPMGNIDRLCAGLMVAIALLHSCDHGVNLLSPRTYSQTRSRRASGSCPPENSMEC